MKENYTKEENDENEYDNLIDVKTDKEQNENELITLDDKIKEKTKNDEVKKKDNPI